MNVKAHGAVDLTVKSVEDSSNPNGEFYAVLSTASVDRDGEIVDYGAFDPLPAKITIDVDHGLSVATTVGSGVPSYEDDRLVVRGTYSSIPRAQEVRTLVNEGHISTMSVAFLHSERSKDEKGAPHITKADLANATFCAVPVNTDALVLAAKSLKAGARNSAKDADAIQAIHDGASYLGAACSAKAAGRDARTKAVAGSYEDRQEDILEALVEASTAAIAAAYPNADPGEYGWLLRIVATFDDRVVYRIGWDSDDAFQVAYTWDGEEAAVTGTPEAVQIDEVVSPAPAGDQEESRPTAAAKAAAAVPDEITVRAFGLSLVALATAAS